MRKIASAGLRIGTVVTPLNRPKRAACLTNDADKVKGHETDAVLLVLQGRKPLSVCNRLADLADKPRFAPPVQSSGSSQLLPKYWLTTGGTLEDRLHLVLALLCLLAMVIELSLLARHGQNWRDFIRFVRELLSPRGN